MSKTVTKADIAKSICAQSEMKQQHAKKVLDAMPANKGRNPQTGEELTLASHDVLAFRISRKFKAAMNSEQ